MKPVPKHLGGHSGVTHTDHGALQALKDLFPVTTMLDIGCGPGGMRAVANTLGVGWLGVDGDPNVAEDDGAAVITHDFTTGPFERAMLPEHFRKQSSSLHAVDLAWSTEFVEHVAEEFQPNYMAAFALAAVVCMTAAPPGKKGYHHVNCRDEEYWCGVFGRYGFEKDGLATLWVRTCSEMKREFMREHGLVFVRKVK